MAEERRFTDEQLRAIERRDGSLLLSAGAGTGKTSVLVERFVRAVVEDGVEVDSILAITFTAKAAAELRTRVHRRFLDYELPERARDAEAAWISTIHGFCARVLRTHSLPAGLDPEMRVLDGLEAERVAIDSFDRALGDFLGAGDDPERLRLIAAYTPDRLADMVRTAYSHLRSRGLLGERDRENRVHLHPVLHHRPYEALDQDGGLAGARARTEQQRAVAALDRTQLLVGEPPLLGHHASVLQIEG